MSYIDYITTPVNLGLISLLGVVLTAAAVYYAFRADRRAKRDKKAKPSEPKTIIKQHGQGSVGVIHGSLNQTFTNKEKGE